MALWNTPVSILMHQLVRAWCSLREAQNFIKFLLYQQFEEFLSRNHETGFHFMGTFLLHIRVTLDPVLQSEK